LFHIWFKLEGETGKERNTAFFKKDIDIHKHINDSSQRGIFNFLYYIPKSWFSPKFLFFFPFFKKMLFFFNF